MDMGDYQSALEQLTKALEVCSPFMPCKYLTFKILNLHIASLFRLHLGMQH